MLGGCILLSIPFTCACVSSVCVCVCVCVHKCLQLFLLVCPCVDGRLFLSTAQYLRGVERTVHVRPCVCECVHTELWTFTPICTRKRAQTCTGVTVLALGVTDGTTLRLSLALSSHLLINIPPDSTGL